MIRLIVLTIVALLTTQSTLRIVVIEGEGAVNIIQQKTAVAPIVEVRDRNNLPVGGVTVTFTIQGGKTAAFAGGSQTVTVTTNAAGRAMAAAVNPLSNGTVQIQAAAAFQGQTAVATITQTNVMTAAQAGASAASAGGAAVVVAVESAGRRLPGSRVALPLVALRWRSPKKMRKDRETNRSRAILRQPRRQSMLQCRPLRARTFYKP